MKKLNMKFFPNTKDNTHCVQAALRIVLKCIYPKKNFTYKQLERICRKPKNKWTWPSAFLVYLKEKGHDVRLISLFDYKNFAKLGEEYLRSMYPKEVADMQIKMSDVSSEMKNARKMLKHAIYKKQKIIMSDIEAFFNDGWFVIATVNSKTLKRMKGYSGHAVVITGIGKKYVWLHDPGLPPMSNRKVSKELFMKALNYDGTNEIYLIKP